MLDQETVKHVAKLARIILSDKEVEKISKQLTEVFGYMDILKEVDTDNVVETSQVTGLCNVKEKDEILPSQATTKELLACTELPVDSKQIRVLPAIK